MRQDENGVAAVHSAVAVEFDLEDDQQWVAESALASLEDEYEL